MIDRASCNQLSFPGVAYATFFNLSGEDMARCKYGKLKNPIGKRRCKKAPKKGRKGKGKKPSCRHGMLKNPTKTRRCKKR